MIYDHPSFKSGVYDSATAVAYNFDTGNTLATSGAKIFRIQNAGSTKLVVDYAGNVGMGTASPSASLTVSGSIPSVTSTAGVHLGTSSNYSTIQLANSSGSHIDFTDTATDYKGRILYDNASNEFRVSLNAVENFVFSTTPSLTIKNASSQAGSLYLGNSGHGLARGNVGTNDVTLYTTSGDVYISGNGGSATTHMVVKSDGKVGIGTSGPNNKLHVTSGHIELSSGYGIGKEWGTVSGLYRPAYGALFEVGATYGSTNFFAHSLGNSPHFAFRDANDLAAWMVINYGKVGINITDPGEKLHVNGKISIGSNNDKFKLSDEGSYRKLQSYGGSPISLNPEGNNVGIGITSPNFVFHTSSAAVALGAPSSAPTDANLNNSNISFYLDESGNNLKVRVKYSDGTLKTATTALT